MEPLKNTLKFSQLLRQYPKFEKELTLLINKYSIENSSDTPDYILARYIVLCLNNVSTLIMRDTHLYTTAVYNEEKTFENELRILIVDNQIDTLLFCHKDQLLKYIMNCISIFSFITIDRDHFYGRVSNNSSFDKIDYRGDDIQMKLSEEESLKIQEQMLMNEQMLKMEDCYTDKLINS